MTKSERSAEADDWLKQAGRPGARAFTWSGALLVAQDVLQALQWAGVALIAEGVIADRTVWCGWGIAAVLVGGFASVFAGRASRRAALAGRAAVATAVRDDLVAALLPARAVGSSPEPAAAAYAVLELVDQVADYHTAVIPLRRQAPLSMVFIAATIALVNWPAAIVLGVSSALIPLNMKLAGVLAQDSNDRHLFAMHRMNAVVLDSFRGLRTLVTLGAVERRRNDIGVASAELSRTNLDVLKRAFLSSAVMEMVVTFSIAVDATYIGLSLLHYVEVPGSPSPTLFSGLFILMLCPMFFTPLRRAAAAFHDRERAATASRAIVEILDRAPSAPQVDAQDVPDVWDARDAQNAQGAPDAQGAAQATHAAPNTHEAPEAQPLPNVPIGISLDDVVVRAGETTLFRVERLHAEPGVWTAVTGVSGAGKTTLLSVIAGLRPATGTIAWVRDDLLGSEHFVSAPAPGTTAWIGQATVILEDTLAANIRLGRADATDTEVLAAAIAAGLGSVIDRLGLGTVIGDGGWGLSSGEARRVAVARAVLSRARLWILDEPTSHLDPDTEETVLDAIAAASDGATVLVATHSRAVVDRCKAVWRIDDGLVHETAVSEVVS